MKKPYFFPVPSRSVDVLIAGAVFEHISFVWAPMLEVGWVLRPGGYALVLAPSRGHEHNVYDCWRYCPDGYRAGPRGPPSILATCSATSLLRCRTSSTSITRPSISRKSY